MEYLFSSIIFVVVLKLCYPNISLIMNHYLICIGIGVCNSMGIVIVVSIGIVIRSDNVICFGNEL